MNTIKEFKADYLTNHTDMTPAEYTDYVFYEFFGGDDERMDEDDIANLESALTKALRS